MRKTMMTFTDAELDALGGAVQKELWSVQKTPSDPQNAHPFPAEIRKLHDRFTSLRKYMGDKQAAENGIRSQGAAVQDVE